MFNLSRVHSFVKRKRQVFRSVRAPSAVSVALYMQSVALKRESQLIASAPRFEPSLHQLLVWNAEDYLPLRNSHTLLILGVNFLVCLRQAGVHRKADYARIRSPHLRHFPYSPDAFFLIISFYIFWKNKICIIFLF